MARPKQTPKAPTTRWERINREDDPDYTPEPYVDTPQEAYSKGWDAGHKEGYASACQEMGRELWGMSPPPLEQRESMTVAQARERQERHQSWPEGRSITWSAPDPTRLSDGLITPEQYAQSIIDAPERDALGIRPTHQRVEYPPVWNPPRR